MCSHLRTIAPQKGDTRVLKTGILEEVDCKIRSLVEALWLVDVPTRSSCEGHLDHGDPYSHVGLWSYQSPWINEMSLNVLITILGEWNTHPEGQFRHTWALVPVTLAGRTWFSLQTVQTNPQKDPQLLRELQDGARDLASFIKAATA